MDLVFILVDEGQIGEVDGDEGDQGLRACLQFGSVHVVVLVMTHCRHEGVECKLIAFRESLKRNK